MRHLYTSMIASVSVCALYVVYVQIHRSHKLLKTKTLSCEKLPSVVYLFLRYVSRALTRRKGCLDDKKECKQEVFYTVKNCRLDVLLLRRFCQATRYGWDYPDSQYRDIPLCFPVFMCHKLIIMAITDDNFLLSPVGLRCVRQSIRTQQAVDELKKGPFMLQVGVLLYRLVDAGVEVDVCLSAFSRHDSLVWESVVTLLSQTKVPQAVKGGDEKENEGESHEVVPADAKQVDLRVPLSTGPPCPWSFFDCWVVCLPAALFGLNLRPVSSLWMLSVCLAEVEKHNGVGDVTSPVDVVVQWKDPLLAMSKVKLLFWKCPTQDLAFQVRQHSGRSKCHLMGKISRT
ncbi:uncharacterized protein si:ch211-12e13.1 [Entelurus aequoreus]|uniref:uncharacterized protein si:ch211-12e13.1 n=1 Tax=Entelurus aequoreus TaxID=161455 RepID=UPI002B1DA0C5|nr:uncharacterized protein si:ch211-12e13.1 [Entelurus aequoreus]XP_061907554.1 uncharacterized protein si:ch211-12e13.1 [Entelurus aequoreus]